MKRVAATQRAAREGLQRRRSTVAAKDRGSSSKAHRPHAGGTRRERESRRAAKRADSLPRLGALLDAQREPMDGYPLRNSGTPRALPAAKLAKLRSLARWTWVAMDAAGSMGDAWDALRGMVDSRLSLAQMVAGIREVTTTARDRAAAAAAAAAAVVAGKAARTALVLAVTAVAAATVVAAEEEMQQTAGGLEKAGADGAAGSLNEQSTFVERMRQWYGRAQALRNKRREQDGPAAKARARWERRPGGRLARKRESGSGAGELRAAVERSGAGAAAAAAKAATETSAGSELDKEDDRGRKGSDESSGSVVAAAKSKDYMAAPTGEDNLTNDEDSDGDGGGEVQLKRAGRAKAKAEAARVAEREEEEKKSGGGEGGAGG